MPSFRPFCRLLSAAIVLALVFLARVTAAQSEARGFAAERLYLSAPGGAWLVMDDLSMHGRLGGALALTTGYAKNPVRVGSAELPVVSDQLSTNFGFAANTGRFRLSLNLDAPISTQGESGTVGDYHFTGPTLKLSNSPDSFADARLGMDVRVLGEFDSPLRLGLGAQLLFATGKRFDYDSDGKYRAMARALIAGDHRSFSYAGQLGVHLRALNDSVPDAPRGSELLFGAAAGLKCPLGTSPGTFLTVGPEVFGETAFNAFFGNRTTGLEALLSARLEEVSERGALVRFKLGAGGGLDPHFGAPEWRFVLGVELSDQLARHDSL
jgi:hypothetical protein